MGIFDFFKQADINQQVEECKATPGAMLIDVRTPSEYGEGRIPGSINVPLQSIGNIGAIVKDKSTPLYVYCYSGARSRQAVNRLHKTGYTGAVNIGGIAAYSGRRER